MFVTYRRLGHKGRLGNQLFQIAATIGAARANDFDFVLPHWPYAKHFERVIPQSRCLWLRRTKEFKEQCFVVYRPVELTTNTSLFGYFHSEKYFALCAEEVRKWFAPSPALLDRLRSRNQSLLAENTCALHVRRGDYTTKPKYISLADTQYYERAMEQFDPATIFLVFSDDPAWCKTRFAGSRFHVLEPQADIEDLFLMSLCRGQIIANSSFSWWGAWLNADPQKKVVAPQQWFTTHLKNKEFPPETEQNQFGFLTTRDLLPAQWIRAPLA